MEAKKSPKADLENKRGAFLQVGLILSLLVVIGLFSWSQSEQKVDLMAGSGEVVEQDVMDVTVQDQKPPEPQKVETAALSDIIKIVKDNVKIDQEIAMFDDYGTGDLSNIEIKTNSRVEQTVEEEEPVFAAEEAPLFKGGGLDVFRKWVMDGLVYPALAAENGIQGKVTLMFTVEKDGSVTKVVVVRGIDNLLDREAVKMVSASPKWTPAKNHGKAVRFNYIMPVDFILK